MRRIPANPVNGYRSMTEARVAAHLERCDLTFAYEPVTIKYQGRKYTPDFLANGAFLPRLIIEVKPTLEIALREVRSDMLVYGSPLWFVGEVFIIAADDGWLARGESGAYVECALSRNCGLEWGEQVA